MLTKLRICLYTVLSISGVAAASEAAVKQGMLKNYPGMQVESVTKAPIARLYEVFAGGEVFYVDENVNFLIVRGRLIDVARKTDLTEERTRVLTAIKFDQLPLNLAFRMVKGSAPATSGNRDTLIEKILAFGRQKGISGTPTLFFADGHRTTGAVPADQLEKLLDGAR